MTAVVNLLAPVDCLSTNATTTEVPSAEEDSTCTSVASVLKPGFLGGMRPPGAKSVLASARVMGRPVGSTIVKSGARNSSETTSSTEDSSPR
eukprot:CAMPEP_0119185178 /NCGR_PEP_ID=MMETSP1315-20130426/68125_1 /TAXON_ID=676789 /ORGANISM="Prasinoderma singularis, Strain RCC927" /LENGTH=91 /DNA_ID=CAMNT_0007179607 /DNA_START=76 /DNA_END=351 /DNA_ORIENTATION=+